MDDPQHGSSHFYTHAYTYGKYNIYIYLSISHIYFFITCFTLIIFHILFMSSFTLLLILVTIYYHRIAVICFSYYIICFTYTCNFLLCFMPAKTLEADTGNNYMYPKVLSLYEIVISICMYPKVLSLYETMISTCMTQTGPRYL